MSLLSRVVLARPRLFAALALGLLLYPMLPGTWTQPTRALVSWDTAIALYVALALLLFFTEPQERMQAAAERQEEGEWTIFSITVGVVAFSMVAVLTEFSGLKDMAPKVRALHVTLVGATILLSWMVTQVTFAFRYAHEYYQPGPHGPDIARGLVFPSEGGDGAADGPPPDYIDFLYFAVVLGMTFQVSDVQITSKKFRLVAMLHGIIAFVFNATIIALTVNLAAGLL